MTISYVREANSEANIYAETFIAGTWKLKNKNQTECLIWNIWSSVYVYLKALCKA